jgi:hypothetical protein
VRFEVGDVVRIAMTKWGDRRHWEYDALWLGSDQHGEWLGLPPKTAMARPGFGLVSQNIQVGLVPAFDPDVERGWFAGFHGEPRAWVDVYVDITTPPVWDGATLRAVDLDLDVIRKVDGEVFVDDEDEFAVHQVELGYPDDVIAAATGACEWVTTAVTQRRPPFDGSHETWLDMLENLIAGR